MTYPEATTPNRKAKVLVRPMPLKTAVKDALVRCATCGAVSPVKETAGGVCPVCGKR